MGFAVWLGRLAAAGAAVLAVVWLIEASPDDPHKRPAAQASIDSCRLRALVAEMDIAAMPRQSWQNMEDARRRLEACGPAWTPRTTWDGPKAMQGLVAAAIGVALLIFTAIGAKADEFTTTSRRPPPSYQELDMLVAEEQAAHFRRTGELLPKAQARQRVDAQLVREGRLPGHG